MKRFCQVCDTEFIEDERHFLYGCQMLKSSMDPFMYKMAELVDGWNVYSKLYRTKLLCSEEHLKRFARWLERMHYARHDIIYR